MQLPQKRIEEVIKYIQPSIALPRLDSLKRHVQKKVEKYKAGSIPLFELSDVVSLLVGKKHASDSIGPLCDTVNITQDMIASRSGSDLKSCALSNGMFVEIIQYLRKTNTPWYAIADIFEQFNEGNAKLSADAIRYKYISVIHRKYRLGKDTVNLKTDFVCEKFTIGSSSSSTGSSVCSREKKKLQTKIFQLKSELKEVELTKKIYEDISIEYKAELVARSEEVNLYSEENIYLESQFQSAHSKNLGHIKNIQELKKSMLNYSSMKIKEKEINILITEIENLTEKNELSMVKLSDLQEKVDTFKHSRNKFKSLLHYYKSESEKSKKKSQENVENIKKLELDLQNEVTSSIKLQHDLDINSENSCSRPVIRNDKNSVCDEVRQLVAFLHSKNISTENIPLVIKSVGNSLFNTELENLPSEKTCRNIITEANILAKIQVAEYLDESTNAITAHYDGTSDKQKKFYGIQVTCENQSSDKNGSSEIYTGRLSEVGRENAETEFSEIKAFFTECAELLAPENAELKFEELFLKYGNNMSDRSGVNTKLHKMEQEMKDKILNSTIASDKLKEAGKMVCSKIHNFKCAVHPLLTLADDCDKQIQTYEKLVLKQGHLGSKSLPEFKYWSSKDKSQAFSLLRTVSKALSSNAHAAAGHPEDWKVYLESINECNSLVAYERQRFNIPFQEAAAVFYHKKHILDFIRTYVDSGADNKLLRSVFADIQDSVLLAEVQAIGILYHQITEPYFRLTKGKKNILELNAQFKLMFEKLNKFYESPLLLLSPPTECVFENVSLLENEVTKSLYSAQDFDTNITGECLKLVLSKFISTLTRQLKDQLEGGKFYEPSTEMLKQSQTVTCSNMRGESDFGSLKRQKHFAPNASTMSHETSIMWERNKPNNYLNSLKQKNPEKYNSHMKAARKLSGKVVNKYRERSNEIKALRRQMRLDREKEFNEKEKKACQIRENILKGVQDMGGAVQSKDDILNLIKTNPKQIKQLLKIQINYYRYIIKNPNVNKKLYQYSVDRKILSTDQLQRNLQEIIDCSTDPSETVVNVREVASYEDRAKILSENYEKNSVKVKASSTTSTRKRPSIPPTAKSKSKTPAIKKLKRPISIIKRAPKIFQVPVQHLERSVFVAVAFNQEWFPGQITHNENIENDEITVNYMHPHKGNKFVWPAAVDEQTTNIRYIFSVIEQPLPTAGGRGNYVCSIFSDHAKIQVKYEQYCKKFNMH